MTPYDIPDIPRVDEIVDSLWLSFAMAFFFRVEVFRCSPTTNSWNFKKEFCRCLELPLRVMVRWQSLCCVEYCRVLCKCMCTKNMIVVHGLSLWDLIPYPTQCWESWTLEIQHGSSTWWFGKAVSFRTPYNNGAHFNIQSLVCNYKKQETSGFTSYKLHRRSSTN